MAQQTGRRLALFDFDGTIVHLGTDYPTLRAELERLAGAAGISPNGGSIYDLSLRLADDVEADETVVRAELAGLGEGLDLDAGLELYRSYAESGAELAIVTHNSREVVEAFFARNDLPEPAEIFDRRALAARKADSHALLDYTRGAESVVVVGDSHFDRARADRIGADFVHPLQSYYDRKAVELDELAATYESAIPYKRWFYGRRSDAVMAALGAEAGDDVLEVGCGSGWYTRALVRLGTRVTASDLSPAYLEQARRLAPEARFQVEDAQRLSFPNESFDRVLLTEVIEHVPEPARAVREAARALRPEGVLALTTPSRRSPMNLAYTLKRRILRYGFNEHLHELTARELRALLEPDFEVESFTRVNAVLPYPLDSLYVRLGSPALPLLERADQMLGRLGWTMVVRARKR